jgi:hypothetical protein
MQEIYLPRVALKTEAEPPRGMNTYQAIPEMVEFRRSEVPGGEVHTIALGRLAISMESESRELVSLQSYVKTGRWKTSEHGPSRHIDAQGVLVIKDPGGDEGFAYHASEARFFWHEESASLHIALGDGAALAFKVADCLMVEVDREGRLTDIWMLGLDLEQG